MCFSAYNSIFISRYHKILQLVHGDEGVRIFIVPAAYRSFLPFFISFFHSDDLKQKQIDHIIMDKMDLKKKEKDGWLSGREEWQNPSIRILAGGLETVGNRA